LSTIGRPEILSEAEPRADLTFTKSNRIQSRGCPFENAEAVTLVHPDATLHLHAKLLVNKCVSVSDFREFVSTLEDTTVKVTNNNVKGLSLQKISRKALKLK
jgi:hypothetical protein